MAIDTVQKRVSALVMTLPFPDAILSSGDRAHTAAWHYAGFTYALPVPIAPIIHMVNIQLILIGQFTNIVLE